jgi:beta-lactam-binding protein with PASTA domain
MSNPVDTSGNVAVDFVWGNLPLQPDDNRVTSPTQTTTVGADQNHSWTYVSTKTSAKITASQDSEVIASEAWDAFPGYAANTGVSVTSDAITIPDVTGYGFIRAVDALVLAGANVGTVTYNTAGATPANTGTIYSTSVTGSSTKGTTTNLVVYKYQDATTPGVTYNTAIGPWVNGYVAG